PPTTPLETPSPTLTSVILISMSKSVIWIAITVGGVVGSYIPVLLFHSGELSGWSILGGVIGSFAGVWVAVKLNNNI
ncbi:MAG TPA: hypothetical protein VMT23_00910, partial [Candidatus Binatia bacterium]|nr:hypothetical protein [Candidatus Binatia bacterium]